MKRSKFSEEQIIYALRQAESGTPIGDVCRQLGIAEHIVTVGFGITWGGVVLAAALAFGLGGKDLARSFLERRLAGPAYRQPGDDVHHH